MPGQQFQNKKINSQTTTTTGYNCRVKTEEVETQTILAVQPDSQVYKAAFAHSYDILEQSDDCQTSSAVMNRDVIRMETFSFQIPLNEEFGSAWGAKITKEVYKVDENSESLCLLIDFSGGDGVDANLDDVKTKGNIALVVKAPESLEDAVMTGTSKFEVSGKYEGQSFKNSTILSFETKYIGEVDLEEFDLSVFDDMTFGTEFPKTDF